MEFGVIDLIIVILKAALVMGALLHMAAMVTWVERKGSALIQNRVGANRAAILGFDLAGIFNTLVADPVKAITKEDFLPRGVSQFMHSLAPFLAVLPIILSFAVVPFGPPIEMKGGNFQLPLIGWNVQLDPRTITMRVADLDAGILFVFAMGSLAVYGVVLAGWVSSNKFSLFGSLRATAQMISYEVTMGLSLIGVLVAYQTLDLASIVSQQTGTVLGFLPRWGIFLCPFNVIAFFVFFTSMMAETKRAPFDLPESESELAAGYFTEYSGMKFLLFWLGEFAEITVASAIFVVLFFGGWHLPWVDMTTWGAVPLPFGLPHLFEIPWASVLGPVVFGAKVSFFCVLQVVIRWTLPRFRYDQVMDLCWKLMLPISLANLVATVAWLLWMKG